MEHFKVSSGRIVISDPCYKDVEPIQAINGKWLGEVELNHHNRIRKLTVQHSDYILNPKFDNVMHTESAVDSGQLGVFDSKSYRNDKLVVNLPRLCNQSICEDEPWYSICCDRTLSENNCGYVPEGFLSSSGYGDGFYQTKVFLVDNKAVAVEIEFIEEDEEDQDSDYYEDEEN